MGIWFLSLLINSGCNRDLVEYDSNDLKISIEKGEEWLHKDVYKRQEIYIPVE